MMDEHRFWSTALGEWISDCISGPSSSTSAATASDSVNRPIVPESSWRPTSNCELQLRYAELCDGIALSMVFCYLSNAGNINSNDIHHHQNNHPFRMLLLQHQHARMMAAGGGGNMVERSESLSSGVSSSTSMPSPSCCGAGGSAATIARLRQFHQLLMAVCQFYRAKSLLVVSVPDVLCIVRSPSSELSGHEMHKLLALLLGAAVQSEQREHFIERIKQMRAEVQSELAHEIQRVTSGNGDSPVINLDTLLAELDQHANAEDADGKQRRIVALIERSIRERDEYTNGLLEMAQDLEQDETGPSSSGLTTASSSCNGDIPTSGGKCPLNGRSPSPSAMDRHVSVELAAAKAELRKLRSENEEREEMLLEMQDELDKQRAEIGRLQEERLELVKDARAAKDYRDEIDCMQHKLNRLERLEAENKKLRNRLGEMDFYKSRVNHLSEDNNVMQETCRVMEEQLEQYQRKLSAHLEVESKLIEAQANIKSLQLDLTKARERVEEVLVENGRLERDVRCSKQKCLELERQMNSLSEFASPRASLEAMNGGCGSLNESSLLAQLEAHNQSQILELQLENQKLKAAQLEQETTAAANNGGMANELCELRMALTAAEKLAQEKAEECARIGTELQTARRRMEESVDGMQSVQHARDQLERQLMEFRRSSVPMKTHQTVMEQLEQAEQKNQQSELHSRVEQEQFELVKAEKHEVEQQLQRMCAQQRESRAELDTLREQHLAEQQKWERQRKALDTERTALRARADALEAKAAELTVAERNMENLTRRLTECERELAERSGAIQRLQTELAQARQQQEVDARKAQQYREELMAERDRLRDLLARLRSVCLMAIRSGGSAGGTTDATTEQCCLLEPACLDDDVQLIAIIDDILAKALNGARREADALRIQQQKQIRELDDLKRDIIGLRRTGHELNASDNKLLVENRNIKEQVNLLQDRLHRAQSEEATRAAELQAAKREIEELQQKMFSHSRQCAELSNLQMSLQQQQKREEHTGRELAMARAQLDAALKSHADTQKRLDSLELIHSALASDHDRLQNLHQMLSSDYDRVKREKEMLRQKLKGEKSSVEQMLRADFVRERCQLEQLLEAERTERQKDARKIGQLETDLANATRELTELKREHSTAAHRSDQCQDELRRLRMAECAQKSTNNNLNVIIQQLNNALTEKDLELANLRRQVEMLRQYTGDENKTLIRQIELLLIQNQQLHNRSDAFYAEQKELQEKLLTLRRHKEKLEEKIMDQYKAMDSRKLERPTFMKRAAKALIAKSPSRKNRAGNKDSGNNNSTTSDKSEESSIYSTENEMAGAHQPHHRTTPVLGSPPPPPPACAIPSRAAISQNNNNSSFGRGGGGAMCNNAGNGGEYASTMNTTTRTNIDGANALPCGNAPFAQSTICTSGEAEIVVGHHHDQQLEAHGTTVSGSNTPICKRFAAPPPPVPPHKLVGRYPPSNGHWLCVDNDDGVLVDVNVVAPHSSCPITNVPLPSSTLVPSSCSASSSSSSASSRNVHRRNQSQEEGNVWGGGASASVSSNKQPSMMQRLFQRSTLLRRSMPAHQRRTTEQQQQQQQSTVPNGANRRKNSFHSFEPAAASGASNNNKNCQTSGGKFSINRNNNNNNQQTPSSTTAAIHLLPSHLSPICSAAGSPSSTSSSNSSSAIPRFMPPPSRCQLTKSTYDNVI